MTTLKDCILINLPKITDARGNLSVIEENQSLPFLVKRIFYLYNMPKGAKRGVHALKKTAEVVFALNGSFEVILDDGIDRKTVLLSNPNVGLLIPPGVWRELTNFSPGTIVLALASEAFSKDDYIGDYECFKKTVATELK
jgi:dTDP-4-dehydrorhamnose 3,5-epimerase-like enzyme